MDNFFKAAATFSIPEKNLFCISGQVESGAVRAGMLVNVSLSSGVSIEAPIKSVEMAQTSNGTRVVLTILVEDKGDFELWSALRIGDELLQVTEATS